VSIEGDYYSAPHIHRHKKLRVKLTENQVEIFLNLERLAVAACGKLRPRFMEPGRIARSAQMPLDKYPP
jgi:hypothetical protein